MFSETSDYIERDDARLELFKEALDRQDSIGNQVVEQMKTALTRFQAWRLHRKERALQRSLLWWERERAKGQTEFVIRSALTYGLTIVGVHDVYNNLFEAGTDYYEFVIMVLFWPVVGMFIGSNAWDNWESKYQKALREARKVPPDPKTLPKSY